MRVLVACEFSGVVREAFRARGHDAMSCDRQPSELPGPHVQDDVTAMLREPWDLVIAHPPCTYLANSGARWLVDNPERWLLMEAAARFFRRCLDANAPRVAVENPIMHRHGRRAAGIGRPDCSIQPWQHGHGEIKRTCFWLRGLSPLRPTNIVSGREPRVHHMGPGPERKRERSRTLPGIAAAMATQWGGPNA